MILSNYLRPTGLILDSWKIAFLATAILLKVSMVSSVAEDYYNPDYDEEEILNPSNWGGILGADSPEKRHLGALASTSSRHRAFSKSMGNDMGLLPSSKGLKFARVAKSGHTAADGESFSNLDASIKSPFEDNRWELSSDAGTDANLNANDDSFDHGELNPNFLTHFMEGEANVKEKRFMGALARGGWFPRQFRGVVERNWDKRHIGAAARLGWMPYGRMYRKTNDASFKRNIGSLRKYNPTAPKLILHR